MNTRKLIAFHNDSAVKEKYLARVRAHREADQLIRGKYWEDGKGGSIGCTIHSSDHQAYEVELGIPSLLARLEDITFERLKNAEAMVWPEQFLDAIPVGADLSMVWPSYALWMLSDSDIGMLRYTKTEQTWAAIERVTDIYSHWVERGVQPEAAKLRADAYATYAANPNVDAARSYSTYADIAYSYAANPAHSKNSFWRASAAKLLELLAASPVAAEVHV